MNALNLNAFRQMMGKYNLGNLVLSKGADGSLTLEKQNNHASFFGRLINGDSRLNTNATENREVRQALYDALRADIMTTYGENNTTANFLADIHRQLFAGYKGGIANCFRALERSDDVANILDQYDAIRLAWKPLVERQIAQPGQAQVNIGPILGENDIQTAKNHLDLLMASFMDPGNAGNAQTVESVEKFISLLTQQPLEISSTEVRTLLRTRWRTIKAYVNQDFESAMRELETLRTRNRLRANDADQLKRHLLPAAIARAILRIKLEVEVARPAAGGANAAPNPAPNQPEQQPVAGQQPRQAEPQSGQVPHAAEPGPVVQQVQPHPIAAAPVELPKTPEGLAKEVIASEFCTEENCDDYLLDLFFTCPNRNAEQVTPSPKFRKNETIQNWIKDQAGWTNSKAAFLTALTKAKNDLTQKIIEFRNTHGNLPDIKDLATLGKGVLTALERASTTAATGMLNLSGSEGFVPVLTSQMSEKEKMLFEFATIEVPNTLNVDNLMRNFLSLLKVPVETLSKDQIKSCVQLLSSLSNYDDAASLYANQLASIGNAAQEGKLPRFADVSEADDFANALFKPDQTLGITDAQELAEALNNESLDLSMLRANKVKLLGRLKTINGGTLQGVRGLVKRCFDKPIEEIVEADVQALEADPAKDPFKGLSKAKKEVFALLNAESNFADFLTAHDSTSVRQVFTALLTSLASLTGSASQPLQQTLAGTQFTLSASDDGQLKISFGDGKSIPMSVRAATILSRLEGEVMLDPKKFGRDATRALLPPADGQANRTPLAREYYIRVLASEHPDVQAVRFAYVPTETLEAWARQELNGAPVGLKAELDALVPPRDTDTTVYSESALGLIRQWNAASAVDKNTVIVNDQPSDRELMGKFLSQLIATFAQPAPEGTKPGERLAKICRENVSFLARAILKPEILNLDAQVKLIKTLGLAPDNPENPDDDPLSGIKEQLQAFKDSLQEIAKTCDIKSTDSETAAGQKLDVALGIASKSVSGDISNMLAEKYFLLAIDELNLVTDFASSVKPFDDKTKEELQNAALKLLKGDQQNASLRPNDLTDEGFKNLVKANAEKLRAPGFKNVRDIRAGVLNTTIQAYAAMTGAEADVANVGEMQNKLFTALNSQLKDSLRSLASVPQADNAPIWSKTLDELMKMTIADPTKGYGKFVIDATIGYLDGLTPTDRQLFLNSFMSLAFAAESKSDLIAAAFKSMGPLMQKILQGIPTDEISDPDLKKALDVVKSKLSPIPRDFVRAQLYDIKLRSKGQIKSIEMVSSLGRASVGEALLCRVVTDDNPNGKEVVVKILRPDSQNRMRREAAYFTGVANGIPGMGKTYAGQLARLEEEFDFTSEARKVQLGRVYDRAVDNSVRSVMLNNLSSPTTGVLLLEKAPGTTVDRYAEKVQKEIDALLKQTAVADGSSLRPKAKSIADFYELRAKLATRFNDLQSRQTSVRYVAETWISEAFFKGGFFHGDLHDGNIMTASGGATIIDFGNATHMSETERMALMRLAGYAMSASESFFIDAFEEMISSDSKTLLNKDNNREKIHKDLVEVFAKGTGDKQAPERIFAAVAVFQSYGIEIPAAIYNFMQSMLRLKGAMDALGVQMQHIKNILNRLQPPTISNVDNDLLLGPLEACISQLSNETSSESLQRVWSVANEQFKEPSANLDEAPAGGFLAMVYDLANDPNSNLDDTANRLRAGVKTLHDTLVSMGCTYNYVSEMLSELKKLSNRYLSDADRRKALKQLGLSLCKGSRELLGNLRNAMNLSRITAEPYTVVDALEYQVNMTRVFTQMPFLASCFIFGKMNLQKNSEYKAYKTSSSQAEANAEKLAAKLGGPKPKIRQKMLENMGEFNHPHALRAALSELGWTLNAQTLDMLGKALSSNVKRALNNAIPDGTTLEEFLRTKDGQAAMAYAIEYFMTRTPVIGNAFKALSPVGFQLVVHKFAADPILTAALDAIVSRDARATAADAPIMV